MKAVRRKRTRRARADAGAIVETAQAVQEAVQEATEQPEAPTEKESEVDAASRIIAKYKDRIRNPMTGIRAHCIECMGGAIAEVARCASTNCSLHVFRMGKNPYHSRSKASMESDSETE